MKTAPTFILLVCFASVFTSNSMTMLSLEKGIVYTEDFNLTHVIQAGLASQFTNSSHQHSAMEPCQLPCHRHVQLKNYYLPKNKENFSIMKAFISCMDFLPAHQIIPTSFVTSVTQRRFDFGRLLKFPIATLLQTSVLLI